MSNKEQHLHKVYWIWFPVLMFSAIVLCGLTNFSFYSRYFSGEMGVIELATPLVLLPAIIFGIKIFLDKENIFDKKTEYFVLFVTFACLYIAGEELSWGQHLWGWETPQWVLKVNDQQETNLHNMSSWFD